MMVPLLFMTRDGHVPEQVFLLETRKQGEGGREEGRGERRLSYRSLHLLSTRSRAACYSVAED